MDLCVAQNIGCDDQRFWGVVLIAILLGSTVLLYVGQLVWNHFFDRRTTHRRITVYGKRARP